MAMKVNVVDRKLIKPYKPTPSNLCVYKISLIDEVNPSMHLPRILYYPSEAVHGKNLDYLESSLAQVLSLFYPLAGRYDKEMHHVNCNDEGAEYSVAEINIQLHQLMARAEPEQLNHLLPIDMCAADERMDPMLAVRINRFQCGGLAIAVCASHRIQDSASVGLFLSAWADAAMGRGPFILPDFESPSYFPAENVPPLQFEVSRTRDRSIVSRRIVFDKDAIARLRERIPDWRSRTNSEHPPSRVVVVSSFLTQAFLRADASKHGGQPRSAIIAQAINVRERTVPPVRKHSIGTWASIVSLEFGAEERRRLSHNIPAMAVEMRGASMQGMRDCARILSDRKFGRKVLVDNYIDGAEKAERSNYKVVWVTDWSKFGEYELDFGFGKPVWVSLVAAPMKDLIVLTNTKDNDGIEAWVTLHESDMRFFEEDEDLRRLTAAKLTSRL